MINIRNYCEKCYSKLNFSLQITLVIAVASKSFIIGNGIQDPIHDILKQCSEFLIEMKVRDITFEVHDVLMSQTMLLPAGFIIHCWKSLIG